MSEKIAVAPNELRIRGTAERLYGVAGIFVTGKKPDGSLEFEHDGNTDVFWDGQETITKDGKTVFVDEEGGEWTEDQITVKDAPETECWCGASKAEHL